MVAASREKRVVDEVSGWLRVYDDGSVDRTWTGPPEVQFLASPYVPTTSDASDDGVTLHDLIIDYSACNLSLRVYLPVLQSESGEDHDYDDKEKNGRTITISSKLPVLLHFQGGGFCISRPSWFMYYQFYCRLARSTRSIIVSVETRLAPEHRLPAAIDDCYQALLWLRSLARSDPAPDPLGLQNLADFTRVFLIGDSSGGNLVHEVAARAGKEEDGFWSPLTLVGGVPIHPGFVRSERSLSERELQFQSPFLTLEMLDKFLGLALPKGSTKDHPFTCPMGSAAPEMAGLKLPPFLVVVAGNDLIRNTELEYCKAMEEAGKDVEVVVNPGVGHSFYLNKIAVDSDPQTAKQTDVLIQAVRDFIERRH